MASTRQQVVAAIKLIYHSVLQSVFTENLLEVELLASSSTDAPLHFPWGVVATIC